MTFNSISFIILFPATVAVYCLISPKLRYAWLLVCSYLFYFAAGGRFVYLLAASTVIVYLSGLLVEAIEHGTAKKCVLAASVIVCLGLLFIFKYLDFTLELFGSGLRFNLLLPVGISFYTFQAVSYLIDVYRRTIPAEKNILKLALFLSFFINILSGPINRAGDILPQISSPDLSYDTAKTGMQKMLWGYFLKLAIAGRLAIIVDNVYADAGAHSGFAIAVAAVSYLFMLYCDFEGYSQIATGAGYILGIRMKENFRQPFFSKSMGEVWRRWHVSLSTWFRDYLYIPLGGNRKGTVRKYINIFIVLFVSGIWHGANLTFFIWGALNGAYIILGQILLPYRDSLAGRIKEKICKTPAACAAFDRVRNVLLRIGVYILAAHTFIYFSNRDVASAWMAVKGILTRFSLNGAVSELVSLGLGRFNLMLVILMAAFVLIADGQAYRRNCDTPSLIRNIPTALRWTIYYALLIAILFSANLTGKEFIYSMM